MKILLDTNVFYNDWHLKSAKFKYLFHFLNNEGYDLLLSRVVIQEAENIQKRELQKEISELKNAAQLAERLNNGPLVALPPALQLNSYDLLGAAKGRVESVIVLEYASLQHATIVNRALERKRPFQENEKGYRDTLIWLSFLNFLEERKVTDDVIFVSENKSDFFEGNALPVKFHPELLSELGALGFQKLVKPYLSLAEFVGTINKDDHAIDQTKAEELFEDDLDQGAISFLQGPTPKMARILWDKLLGPSSESIAIKSILAVIFEGIEDFQLTATSQMGGGDIFVICSHDLRIVLLDIEISTSDYHASKKLIDSSKQIFERQIGEGTVVLSAGVRPYFSVSFLYNENQDQVSGYSVNEFNLLR